jgi:hypothetical protein
MAGKSTVLGAVVGTAFSAIAVAAPDIQSTEQNSAGILDRQGGVIFGGLAQLSVDVIAAEYPAALNMPLLEHPEFTSSLQNTFLLQDTQDDRGADSGIDSKVFSADGIKITQLQATTTSNRYVASPFAPGVEIEAVDDVKFFAPDYSSVKAMSPVPKRGRSVVGVGLVTIPSGNVKTSDTATKGVVTPPAIALPDKK